jgi:hypothetical protein
MTDDRQGSEDSRPENFSHFVIQLSDDSFIICKRVITINTSNENRTTKFLKEYISEHRLDAAPLPGWSFGFGDDCDTKASTGTEAATGQVRAMSAQAGRFSGQAGKFVFNFYDD